MIRWPSGHVQTLTSADWPGASGKGARMNSATPCVDPLRLVYGGMLALGLGAVVLQLGEPLSRAPVYYLHPGRSTSCRLASWKAIRAPCWRLRRLSSQSSWLGGCTGPVAASGQCLCLRDQRWDFSSLTRHAPLYALGSLLVDHLRSMSCGSRAATSGIPPTSASA